MPISESTASTPVHYGGFWRRLVALIIDYLFISAVLFGLFASAALVVPNAADLVDLSTFGWLTVERTLESSPPKTTQTGDETKTVTEKIVESTVAGRWVYLHRVIETETDTKSSTGGKSHTTKKTEKTRIDPVTRLEVSGTSGLYYFWVPWLIYAVLMQSSSKQATLGKMAIGVQVTTTDGQKPSYARSLARNLSKVVSAITLMVGFMMAGWTRRKQALHDMMAKCLVVVPPSF